MLIENKFLISNWSKGLNIVFNLYIINIYIYLYLNLLIILFIIYLYRYEK